MFATASGGNNASCQNCDTTTTPLWRRAEDGTNLCNACGLFLKLHSRPRPIALKSNIIRSRNRVKTPQNGMKRKTPYDAPATPGEIARQQQHQQAQQQQHLSPYEPHPRSLMTPSQHDDTHAQFTENVFDPQLTHPSNQIPTTTNPFEVNSQENVGPDAHLSKTSANSEQDLELVNSHLRSRVNELEIINDLFRSRVTELEAKQNSSPQDESSEVATSATELALRETIKNLEAELAELKKKSNEAEASDSQHAT
ncbi:putative GATA transcription factor [Taphrina deformans PYCC 5710]|uniref:GATA transcription factor n=1 Tax=Taphrina deformans (strain PYCC 5710 / ATCC 11124 / CBS 356.35 / IMI 108563 / JCM 9778 / NBRC 8474) TaxID=1097556 RepID=R4X709_TAPDE|nr:putative GATA transcription factor [Taphrina deformans PYCC 5710]|eukprot:CCG81026.1 putative GATA transcription factor [Taphrina deformans PYCC 5710]